MTQMLMIEALNLVWGFSFERLIAERGYAAQPFYDWIVEQGMEPVIPPHQQAKEPREYDKWLYRERHLVSCSLSAL